MKTIYRRKGESIDSLIKLYKRARGNDGIKEAYQKHEVFRSRSQKRRQKHKLPKSGTMTAGAGFEPYELIYKN